MIAGAQMRAGRAALRWSIEDLAEKSGVGVRTIIRLEAADGISPSRTQTLLDIKAALEAEGIEFIGTPEEGPGIRLWLREAHTPYVQRVSWNSPVGKALDRRSGVTRIGAALALAGASGPLLQGKAVQRDHVAAYVLEGSRFSESVGPQGLGLGLDESC